MSTMDTVNLYEILQISQDATPEQVRKAYRKHALSTHPDRLPPNATAEEKSAAEERFRKINNAYEILSDVRNRRIYDEKLADLARQEAEGYNTSRRHPHFAGDQEYLFNRSRGRYQPYTSRNYFPGPTPFDISLGFGPSMMPFGGSMHMGGFDSFFDSFFDNFASPFPGPRGGIRHGFRDPFETFRSEFGAADHMFFNDDLFGGGSMMISGFPSMMTGTSTSSFSSSRGGNGRWISEQCTSRTVNGVTETEWRRRDSDGNEHVERSFEDARTGRTIEDPTRSNRRHLEGPPPSYSEYPSRPDRNIKPSSSQRAYRDDDYAPSRSNRHEKKHRR